MGPFAAGSYIATGPRPVVGGSGADDRRGPRSGLRASILAISLWTVTVADLQRVLDESFLEGLDRVPVGDLRRMRSEAEKVESHLSYARRLVQGRLDILLSEISRRESSAPKSDLSSLVASLPHILADRSRSGSGGRLPGNLLPPEGDEGLVAEIDQVAGPEVMGAAAELDDSRLVTVTEGLTELEGRLSGDRRRLFTVIDSIQAELVRRYSTGQASASEVLNPGDGS